ncbi:hypothetical protein M406DRAFT_66611 [Cryphonectria parasitica EP155]|uniref:Uncharacterized protein n=1 Tax=Cryphonectria parasitica (strain ATCC 38755 / EP155) TaxID=660469 RepID=A0A9P4YC66_CRYP1|nr:uncharacterized protein M406DRAFT_66611 [Cryphonectria parasitica EP155]KAF3770187.1 hypothetical protein M406DRAFT_66611 [Cryphonectria parasitica EP155]
MGNLESRPQPPAFPTPIPGLDTELQKVHGLCMASWHAESHAQTLHPERPEYAALMRRPMVPTPEWERTLRKMRTALSRPRAWDPWYRETPLDWFKEVGRGRRLLLAAAAAILLDTQCCGAPDPILRNPFLLDPCCDYLLGSGKIGRAALQPVLEHMLLVDYGLGEQPLRSEGSCTPGSLFQRSIRPQLHAFCRDIVKLAAQCDWGVLPSQLQCLWLIDAINTLTPFASAQLSADISTMLYWFYTRRRKLTDEEYNRGLTGYTGVLQEMILEVPTKGSDRLRRKLSVDANLLIPKYVGSEEQREVLLATARSLAMEHHIEITVPSKDLDEESGSDHVHCKTGEASKLVDNYITTTSAPSPPRYEATEAFPPSYEKSTKS